MPIRPAENLNQSMRANGSAAGNRACQNAQFAFQKKDWTMPIPIANLTKAHLANKIS
jgi:hypothetical protein